MTPAITFIIPAFNAATTLGDTLRSLLAQTRKDWFALIIDDGSTDTTADVAAAHRDPRIRIINQTNAGVAASRNRGLAMSTSPAVCFLDADDTIDPTFVSEMLNGLKSHDLIPASYRYTGPNLEDANWTVHPAATDPAKLIEFNQYAIGAIVFSREALSCHRLAGRQLPNASLHQNQGPLVGAPAANLPQGPFPTSSRHEDWELLLKLQHAYWAPPIPNPLFSYRLRPDSRTTALCEIWRDGLNLIARSHADPAACSRALRRWTLRNLARAATTANLSLCQSLFEHLDTLTAFDTDTLAGALRWSLRRAAVAQEPQSLQHRDIWHAQILTALGRDDLARESLRRAATPNWPQVAAAAAARLGPDQTLVIYGAGRNGREVIQALASQHISLALIDDSSASHPTNIPRVTINDLSPNHLILITPDDRAAILAKLGPSRNAQILLPEQLVA